MSRQLCRRTSAYSFRSMCGGGDCRQRERRSLARPKNFMNTFHGRAWRSSTARRMINLFRMKHIGVRLLAVRYCVGRMTSLQLQIWHEHKRDRLAPETRFPCSSPLFDVSVGLHRRRNFLRSPHVCSVPQFRHL